MFRRAECSAPHEKAQGAAERNVCEISHHKIDRRHESLQLLCVRHGQARRRGASSAQRVLEDRFEDDIRGVFKSAFDGNIMGPPGLDSK